MTGRAGRVKSWTRASVRDLQLYYDASPQTNLLRLDQNANLWGPNPVLEQLDLTSISAVQYPTRDSEPLLRGLSEHYHLPIDQFVAGNGSDELLDLITKAFAAPGQTLAVPWPGYSRYLFYAQLQGLHLERVPLHQEGFLDVDAIARTQPHLVMLASPNNPTGCLIPTRDIERLLARVNGIVVVDEAYMEYAGNEHSLLHRTDEFDNLIVTRTFSKAFALAGLRVGYAAANRDLIARLRRVKTPFNLNVLSESAAVMALRNCAWMHHVVDQTAAERARMSGLLQAMNLHVYPSVANFLLVRSPVTPSVLVERLCERNIAVRAFPDAPGLESSVRIGVGKSEHTDMLVAALRTVPEIVQGHA
jgi:histidinol-phosphate aminotransferase